MVVHVIEWIHGIWNIKKNLFTSFHLNPFEFFFFFLINFYQLKFMSLEIFVKSKTFQRFLKILFLRPNIDMNIICEKENHIKIQHYRLCE